LERRRKDRVMRILHTLPVAAQEAIVESLSPDERAYYGVGGPAVAQQPTVAEDPAERTAVLPMGATRPSPRPRRPEPPSGFSGQLPR
jgi:phospholipid/cholesterol/gamma-HCH transport system ATP-binding protein